MSAPPDNAPPGQGAAAAEVPLAVGSPSIVGAVETLATPDPEQPVPVEAAAAVSPLLFAGRLLLGLGIFVACLYAGNALKSALGLILPGNILGLFILLALMSTRIVPLCGVEAAARWILFLLPLLFVPIFVLALKKAVQLPQGTGYFASVFFGIMILWACTGHLAQWLFARRRQAGDLAAKGESK